MNRLESIKSYLAAYKTKRIREKIVEMKNCSEETLLLHVRAALQIAGKEQEKQTWEPVCLCLFHLLSSIVTESHVFHIVLANGRIYLDELQIVKEWKSDFFYEDEQECIKKELQKQFVRLSDYEIIYAEHWLQYEYRNLMELYWKKQVEKILELKEFKQLKKGQSFFFLFGDYMGSVKVVSQYTREGL